MCTLLQCVCTRVCCYLFFSVYIQVTYISLRASVFYIFLLGTRVTYWYYISIIFRLALFFQLAWREIRAIPSSESKEILVLKMCIAFFRLLCTCIDASPVCVCVVCVYIYVCECVCLYMLTYICICIFISTSVYIYVYVHKEKNK